MNTQKRIIVAIELFILCTCFSIPAFAAESAGSGDVLLELLPADCGVCVRVNNLQNALGQLDQYLTGVTPVPMGLSMMAAMQLAGVLGDPLLNGVDMQGNFAMSAMITGPEKKDLLLFFLIPASDVKVFLEKNTNLSAADSDGVYTLNVPDSPAGELAVIGLTEQKYLLVGRGQDKADLLAIRKMLKDKKASLKSRLTVETGKAAVSAPAWAYVNIDQLYKLYSQEITEGFNEMQKVITQQATERNETVPVEMMSKVLDMYKYFAEQADWFTLSLNPSPQQMQIDKTFSAKSGGELAGMLKSTAAAGKDWKYAGTLDNAAAVKMLMRINKPLWEKLNNRMLDIFSKNSTDADKVVIEKLKSLTSKAFTAIGDEGTVSFSYRDGMPPFEVREMVAVTDAKAMLQLQKESVDLIGQFYQTLGMPMTVTYAPSVEKYKGTDIGLYQFKFTSKDPNDQTRKAVEMMYGKEGLQYPVALTADQFLMTMGSDAMAQLKAMLDAKQTGPAAGDIKAALDLITDNTKAEMVGSINILKLIKGLSQMGQQMAAQSGFEMPDFWKDVKTDTTSCMAAAVFIDNGLVRFRAILPKEHLKETAGVLMQIQQQQMDYYMQKNAQISPDANAAPDTKSKP